MVLGKLAHYGLLLGLPWALHGPAAALTGAIAYSITQSVVLSATFAVSHNVPETKPLDDNAAQSELLKELAERDWAVQQVLTSANWGGVVGNFFTGGLGGGVAGSSGHVHWEGGGWQWLLAVMQAGAAQGGGQHLGCSPCGCMAC